MKNNKLKLIADKTEFLIIRTPMQCRKLDGFFTTHILSQSITPATTVLILGVMLDKNFNFKQHESKTCRCCFYHIHDLHRIRWYISLSVAKTITTALVGSKLTTAIPSLTGYNKTSTCPKLFGKRNHAFTLFFSLSDASEIIALARCALSHYFLDLHNSLSSPLINTTSISKSMLTPVRNSRQL